MKKLLFMTFCVLFTATCACRANVDGDGDYVRHVEALDYCIQEGELALMILLDDGLEFLNTSGLLIDEDSLEKARSQAEKILGNRVISLKPVDAKQNSSLEMRLQCTNYSGYKDLRGEITEDSKKTLSTVVSYVEDVGFFSTDRYITLSDDSHWKLKSYDYSHDGREAQHWKKGDRVLISTTEIDSRETHILINVDTPILRTKKWGNGYNGYSEHRKNLQRRHAYATRVDNEAYQQAIQ